MYRDSSAVVIKGMTGDIRDRDGTGESHPGGRGTVSRVAPRDTGGSVVVRTGVSPGTPPVKPVLLELRLVPRFGVDDYWL